MCDLPVDGLHHRMRLGKDKYRASQISLFERLQRGENKLSSGFPDDYHLHSRVQPTEFEFGIAVAVWFLAICGEKVSPARAHVARHVLHDDGDGVRFSVNGPEQFFIADLGDGAFGKLFVLP